MCPFPAATCGPRRGGKPQLLLPAAPAAPGFLFEHFEMADKAQVLQQFPHAKDWIERLLG